MLAFGPFVLLEEIARGGMGEVWLARRFFLDTTPDGDHLVVVKRVRNDKADSGARARFVDEIRIGLLLAHPGIARTVDAGTVDDDQYLALELVPGISTSALTERMVIRGEQLDENTVLYIGACVMDALVYAHGLVHPRTHEPLQVVHRDISPHNIMVADDGGVRLIDFGVAQSALKETRTEQGIVVGKMMYMSPEQARGDAIDHRADIFAVAVVLYELLTGERYYGDRSFSEVWQVAGTGTYRAPGMASLSADVRRVLEAALQPDAHRRTQTAVQFRGELATLLQRRGGALLGQASVRTLVTRYAEVELAAVARARSAAKLASPPPLRLSRTQSLAEIERDAVQQALAQRQKEAPATTLLSLRESDVAAALHTEVDRTELTPHARPHPLAARSRRTPKREVIFAVVGLVALGIVAGAVFLLTQTPAEGRTVPVVAAQPAPMPEVAPVVAQPVLPPVVPPAPPPPDPPSRSSTTPLCEAVDAVAGCACGRVFAQSGVCLRAGSLGASEQASVWRTLSNCARSCGRTLPRRDRP